MGAHFLEILKMGVRWTDRQIRMVGSRNSNFPWGFKYLCGQASVVCQHNATSSRRYVSWPVLGAVCRSMWIRALVGIHESLSVTKNKRYSVRRSTKSSSFTITFNTTTESTWRATAVELLHSCELLFQAKGVRKSPFSATMFVDVCLHQVKNDLAVGHSALSSHESVIDNYPPHHPTELQQKQSVWNNCLGAPTMVLPSVLLSRFVPRSRPRQHCDSSSRFRQRSYERCFVAFGCCRWLSGGGKSNCSSVLFCLLTHHCKPHLQMGKSFL